MNGLAVLPWSLLLCSVCATIKTLASSSTAIKSHHKNAKYQESSPSSGILSTVAGYKTRGEGSDADGILATSKKLGSPQGITVDKEGNTFIAASEDNKIYKVTASSGIIITVAGGGESYSGGNGNGDGGQATTATLNLPCAVALDTTGNVYIADTGNMRIRKVTVSTGVITTVAGGGYSAYGSDNVEATSTSLNFPRDVAVDATGNIFIVDTFNGLIRKVTAGTGIITTIAGSGSSAGPSGVRGDIANKYYLYQPSGVALDSAGNVYIAGGYYDSCVFKVTVSTGIISVVAGTGPYSNGTAGYNGDDILAKKALLFSPRQVAFDASDNMFINDALNRCIRRVSASTGIITTVAGRGSAFSVSPYDGDGGSAILQPIYTPSGLAVAANGDFYFSSFGYNVVKKVTYTTGSPSSSVTTAPAVTPAVTPSTSSTTESQSSATTHVAQTLYVTMILLSSLLILHLC
jgi:trimeric autotransporter adhesin